MVRANFDGLGVMARTKVMLEVDQRCRLQLVSDPNGGFPGAYDSPSDQQRTTLAAPGKDGDTYSAMATRQDGLGKGLGASLLAVPNRSSHSSSRPTEAEMSRPVAIFTSVAT